MLTHADSFSPTAFRVTTQANSRQLVVVQACCVRYLFCTIQNAIVGEKEKILLFWKALERIWTSELRRSKSTGRAPANKQKITK